MKYQRPGYTETTLIFLEYLNAAEKGSQWIEWLYTTSGFYDNDIKGSFFGEYDTNVILNSPNYNKFIIEYTEAIKNSDKLLERFMQRNEFCIKN